MATERVILLFGREPDSLSDIERAALARTFGAFRLVRIDPVGAKEHGEICGREESGNPVVLLANLLIPYYFGAPIVPHIVVTEEGKVLQLTELPAQNR